VEAILTAIITKDSLLLRKLSYLSQVSPDLLARAVTRLEEVNMMCTDLTGQQVEAILTAIITKDPLLLRKLNIRGANFSQVTPDLLARAVTKLKEVDMRYTHLTKQQVEAILTAVVTKDSLPLRKLDMTGADLSEVAPDLLARAVTRLEEVDMEGYEGCYLTKEQVEAILTRSLAGTSLKVLNMDLDRVQPEPDKTLVSRARKVIKTLH
jgi:hypothetical protein